MKATGGSGQCRQRRQQLLLLLQRSMADRASGAGSSDAAASLMAAVAAAAGGGNCDHAFDIEGLLQLLQRELAGQQSAREAVEGKLRESKATSTERT